MPLVLAACSWTPQWDCGLDPWSTGRWWSPQLPSSPLDPPLCQCRRPTRTASINPVVFISHQLTQWSSSHCVTGELWWRQLTYLQMCSDLGQRGSGDETQVSGAWRWMLCFGFKLLPQLVKVELLLAEPQGFTTPLKQHRQSSRPKPAIQGLLTWLITSCIPWKWWPPCPGLCCRSWWCPAHSSQLEPNDPNGSLLLGSLF